jgi:hypothetical protein
MRPDRAGYVLCDGGNPCSTARVRSGARTFAATDERSSISRRTTERSTGAGSSAVHRLPGHGDRCSGESPAGGLHLAALVGGVPRDAEHAQGPQRPRRCDRDHVLERAPRQPGLVHAARGGGGQQGRAAALGPDQHLERNGSGLTLRAGGPGLADGRRSGQWSAAHRRSATRTPRNGASSHSPEPRPASSASGLATWPGQP